MSMTESERAEIREEILMEMREQRRQYKAEWRKKNPDKVRASNERYWLKKAAALLKKEGECE